MAVTLSLQTVNDQGEVPLPAVIKWTENAVCPHITYTSVLICKLTVDNTNKLAHLWLRLLNNAQHNPHHEEGDGYETHSQHASMFFEVSTGQSCHPPGAVLPHQRRFPSLPPALKFARPISRASSDLHSCKLNLLDTSTCQVHRHGLIGVLSGPPSFGQHRVLRRSEQSNAFPTVTRYHWLKLRWLAPLTAYTLPPKCLLLRAVWFDLMLREACDQDERLSVEPLSLSSDQFQTCLGSPGGLQPALTPDAQCTVFVLPKDLIFVRRGSGQDSARVQRARNMPWPYAFSANFGSWANCFKNRLTWDKIRLANLLFGRRVGGCEMIDEYNLKIFMIRDMQLAAFFSAALLSKLRSDAVPLNSEFWPHYIIRSEVIPRDAPGIDLSIAFDLSERNEAIDIVKVFLVEEDSDRDSAEERTSRASDQPRKGGSLERFAKGEE
ncbi:hypothetical protein BJ322DRAFT_1020646 [Thelephora terrestris]|uniref:Uncharacterized protein n=1 Tax=Thelephora terrestris TaxID=56493 RepID=A0A9P6HGQ0_9AGAM|nr:hypothetical protein BJ322DRAFT_1020646 [Thelephora terrestris]